jgi:hypothetical protein
MKYLNNTNYVQQHVFLHLKNNPKLLYSFSWNEFSQKYSIFKLRLTEFMESLFLLFLFYFILFRCII